MTNEEAKIVAQNMTYEQAIYNVMQGKSVPYKKATKLKLLEMAEKIKTHKGDLISREDAINYLMINMGWYDEDGYSVDDWDEKKSYISDLINGVPSATPQPKVGRWIEIDVKNVYATLKCSVCDRVIEPYFSFGEYSYEDIKTFYPYCHCGARMSGGEEDEVSD